MKKDLERSTVYIQIDCWDQVIFCEFVRYSILNFFSYNYKKHCFVFLFNGNGKNVKFGQLIYRGLRSFSGAAICTHRRFICHSLICINKPYIALNFLLLDDEYLLQMV